jgi:gliding motility-associated lipoprotein GldH
MKLLTSSFVAFAFLFLTGCLTSNTFEKNVGLPHNKWKSSYKPSFEFDITDTTSNYLLFLTIRHTDAYPFSNIWLNVKTTLPNQTSPTEMKTEVPLAQADGKWLGRGMNEIWEHKMPLNNNGTVHFNNRGKYKIELQQIMRENPLPEVMSVGIRLEKIVK